MPKNEPYPELDKYIEYIFCNVRYFYATPEGNTVRAVCTPGRDMFVAECNSWESAYRVSELLEQLRKERGDGEVGEVALSAVGAFHHSV